MLANPILISLGELAMRMMQKMPETIVSLYNNFTLLITNALIIYYNSGNYDAWGAFDRIDWFALISLSITVLLSQTLRFKALQNHKASAL
ncbi:MAG: hypothetical protein ACK521_05125 [bacterium]